MKNPFECEMCGKSLSAFSKSFVCSAACRKRKSRLKQDAFKNAVTARNAMRDLIKGLDLDVIDCESIYDDYFPLHDLLNDLAKSYNARYDRQHSEARSES